ncbi:SDR family oxidoreductase [Rubrobacter aplysinae]|uniref:SDR family oxidoreductase n=1 Tax=Rubrobacter aplysinae TaxID=909625 RepID=UPI00064BB831|nr:SDR family oxidoreductase [Rubrobacter aplysinae]
MKVAVAGAAGNTASRLLVRLAGRGHQVRGLVRREEQLSRVEELGAEPWMLDLEEAGPEETARAVEGCDAVVFAAGAGPGSGPERKQTMDYGGAVKLVEAARASGVGRYLMLSTMNADAPDALGEQMQPYFEAKGAADERLRESGLDYTIIRPGRLTDDAGTGRIDAARSLGRGDEIPREDVAETFAAALEQDATRKETIDVLSGDTPIAEALRTFE